MQRTTGDAFAAWAGWAALRAEHNVKVTHCLAKLSHQVRIYLYAEGTILCLACFSEKLTQVGCDCNGRCCTLCKVEHISCVTDACTAEVQGL